MKSTIFATAALVAAVAADTIGSAIVVNKCEYDVYLYNTPSSGGGYTEVDEVLSTDGSYTQQWTELTNGNGWSIKLSNSTNLDSILQYEYTFQDDGTIWYDLSEVNGNPWDGNWEITANSATCVPRQAAYRYATDDAYGMQSCPEDATITVTLCSGESQDDSAASSISASASAAAQSTSAASTTESAPSSVSATVSYTEAASSTTLQTSVITSSAVSTSSESGEYATTVTQVTTSTNSGEYVATVTQVATATTTAWTHHFGPPSKRDAHHHHAARHPHARN